MNIQHFLKFVFLTLLISVLALAACNPVDTIDSVNQETLESMPPAAVLEVVSKLSQDLNISISEINIVEFESVEWPDSCLGINQADQACAQVITPGYRVVLEVNNEVYEYHSNQDGTVIIQVIQ
jgi:uncharacterized lipoprotein YajG